MKCTETNFGTYECTYAIKTPFPTPSLFANPNKEKLYVNIDKCLLPEILKLWEQGIITTCSCCGHGRKTPTIGVIDEDIPKMKAMEYKVWNNPARPGDEDIFIAKTLCDRQEVLVEV